MKKIIHAVGGYLRETVGCGSFVLGFRYAAW